MLRGKSEWEKNLGRKESMEVASEGEGENRGRAVNVVALVGKKGD